MPDYSKSTIYKLCCNDTNIKDIYIGSTCNFNQRKYTHKRFSNNPELKTFGKHIYDCIRKNGNWENWDMVLVEEVCCENKKQLLKKEREWIEKLEPTLNRNIPTRTKKEYRDTHKEQQKIWHKQWRDKNRDKINKKYYCETCEEYLSHSNKWRHEKSKRHKDNLNLVIKTKKNLYKNKIKILF